MFFWLQDLKIVYTTASPAARTDDAAPMMQHQQARDGGLTSESDVAGIGAQDARQQPRMSTCCGAEAALAQLAACGQALSHDSLNGSGWHSR